MGFLALMRDIHRGELHGAVADCLDLDVFAFCEVQLGEMVETPRGREHPRRQMNTPTEFELDEAGAFGGDR